MLRPGCRIALFAWMVCSFAPLPAADLAAPEKLDFNRHIRPLLADNCFQCHGPDNHNRQAGLRLDLRATAIAKLESGETGIVPGKSSASAIIARITSTDPDLKMPPASSNKHLTAAQQELLRKWIDQGAEYREHWAFVPPQPPAIPTVQQQDWARQPLDRFVLAKLEAAKVKPATEADRATLIRRLSLDLHGLPPTPAEVDAFVADTRPEAYEQLVDRLLASPRFGERMAIEWLDAARYSDSHGYQDDAPRQIWAWRDWVIGAFNRNLPYDQFTIEQLAGDLLPNPTRDQRIATGFNRNHRITGEGGSIAEEFLVEYVVDRVETTSTVWLGLTMGCSRCHDHKFDPITQRNFFEFYAFFNGVNEPGIDRSLATAPKLLLPTEKQAADIARLDAQIKDLSARLAGNWPEADVAQSAWEQESRETAVTAWQPLRPLEFNTTNNVNLHVQDDLSLLADDVPAEKGTYRVTTEVAGTITALRLEVLPDDKHPAKGPGRAGNGNFVLTDFNVRALPKTEAQAPAPPVMAGSGDGQATAANGESEYKPVPLKSVTASFSQKNYPVAGTIDHKPDTGWAILPQSGQAQTAQFLLEKPLALAGGTRLEIVLAFESKFSNHQLGRFRLSTTDSPDPLGSNKLPDPVLAALKLDTKDRKPAHRNALQAYFRNSVFPAGRELTDALGEAKKDRTEIDGQLVATMVMEEMAKPRPTYILNRGQYDQRGEQVASAVPGFLPPMAENLPRNRLGLARWLVDPQHPLTARVAVNRYWQQFFGTGLVKTANDFGSQGEWPSHPELLDFLALDFVSHQWDIKRFVKTLVTSATYRQATKVSPKQIELDPENRLLARGARFRLPAELLRDNALAISGLLVEQIGGPPVKPYQPARLWEEITFNRPGSKYIQDHGDALYRRSLYMFWKRTISPPLMSTFDGPTREICTVNRSRTNTPLQALVLLNEPAFVEASRVLAQKMLTEGGATPAERLTYAFRRATGRQPTATELTVLQAGLNRRLAKFQADKDGAAKLLAIGEYPLNKQLDVVELAAYCSVASVILNLDETITKE